MIKKLFIKENETIKKVMKVIDSNSLGIAFVVDEKKVLKGTVTDGDIRRALFAGRDKNSPVKEIMNTRPFVIEEGLKDSDAVREILLQVKDRGKIFNPYHFLKVPVVDKAKRVVSLAIFDFNINRPNYLSRNKKISKGLVKKVLVVGGAGYLGSVLCSQLLKSGYIVKILDVLAFGDKPLQELKKSRNLELTIGDVRDTTLLPKLLKDIDAVIHLAAIVGDPASMKDPEDTISTNYLATVNLAQACKYYQINRFIFASTCSVYGEGSDKLDEDAQLNPVSLYARSKIESEKGILDLADDNFSPVIFRMATLYGLSPRMRFDLVVNAFAKKATLEGKITIFGGDQWRPFLHVEDAARAYIQCLETSLSRLAPVFNLGSNEQNYQIKEIGEMVKKIFPNVIIEIKIKGDIDGREDRRNYNVIFDKIETELGFKVNKKIEDALVEISRALQTGIIKNPNLHIYYNF